MLSDALSGMADSFNGWEIIGDSKTFAMSKIVCTLDLTREKLKNRTKEDVAIFNFSLDPDHVTLVDRNSPVEEDGLSSRHSSAHHDLFFLALKSTEDTLLAPIGSNLSFAR